jgi:hypothetical protein
MPQTHQGDKVTPTEQTACALQGAKIRSPRTGIFATLRAHLHTQGTGAPSRLALAFALSLSALALTATPALAETPETPELKVEQIFATTATFKGVLSPKATEPNEGGTYQFVYRAAKACKGAGEKFAPASPGLSLGAPVEAVNEPVSGLTPNTEYTVCLSMTNLLKSETAVSPGVSFKTTKAAPPEAPEATEVTERKATTATLNGVVNPLKEGEPGKYRFLYSQSASVCTGGSETTEEVALGSSPQPVSAAITGLEPGKPYTFCVKAFNALSEATLSTPKTFTTALPPETPEGQAATEVTATSWNLHGVLNPKAPGEPGAYEFRYRASATECEGEDENRAPEPSGEALGNEKEAVSTPLTGLLPTTTYTFCLRAENAAGEAAVGPPETFTTPVAPPTVTEESSTGITATEATLSAQIDPGGAPTTYEVEYEPGKRTAEQTLPASKVPVGVQQRLTGLTPATEYQFRFVATNSLGTTEGALVTFKTPSSGGASALTLPDGRAYEMVSPPDGRDVFVPETASFDEESTDRKSFYPYRASADGDAVVYEGDAPSTGGNGFELPNGTGNAFFAARGLGGWSATDITPPSPQGPKELVQGENYVGFSSDLSIGTLVSREGGKGKPLTEGASICDGLYQRTSDGAFHALFETTPIPTPSPCGYGQFYAGASAASTHRLFQTKTALSSEAEESKVEEEGCGERMCNLYDSVGGRLISVNTLGGKPAPDATFGSQVRDINSADLSNVISEDGSRIFWTDLNTEKTVENPEGTTRLFVRENDAQPPSPLNGEGKCTVPADSCTVQIDKAESKASGPSGGGRFWTATSDGSKVFFTDCSRLTEDSTAVSTGGCLPTEEAGEPTGNDLYEYDVGSGQLTDLTVDHSEDPLGANVLGVIGASRDGSYVYFVAGGVLAPGATFGSCTRPSGANEPAERAEEREGKIPPGRGCNLYLLHRGEPLRFITALAPGDNHMPGADGNITGTSYGDWHANIGGRTAQITPDGRHLVFESRHTLPKYNNASSGEAVVEALVYDADTNRLSCVSCAPSGAPPQGGEGRRQEGLLPGSALGNTVSTYFLRWMSEDGSRVFFDSGQPLVPQDNNGVADVYEWEQEGVSGCPTAATARQDGGCTFLLSGGNSADVSLFVDASANGNDVFFTTRSRLVPRDRNENVKLYDARVDGGFPETSLACTGTGCQGVPPGPPSFATPSSATFNGVGNFTAQGTTTPKPKSLTRAQKLAKALKACTRSRVKRKRISCEKHARKLYAPAHKARKATRARGGRRHL